MYGADFDSESSSLTCQVCGATFLNSVELKTHMHSHSDENQFKCDECDSHFKFQANLLHHKQSHLTQTFRCEHCSDHFKLLHELETHVQRSHPGFTPPKMNYSLPPNPPHNIPPPSSLGVKPESRLGKKKFNSESLTSLISPTALNSLSRGEDGKYSCPFCSRGFDRRWNLKCHILIHTANHQKKSGGGSTISDVRYIQGEFACPECHKMFRNLHNLRRHALTKHGMTSADLAEANDSIISEPSMVGGAGESYKTGASGAPSALISLPKKPRLPGPRKTTGENETDFKFWCPVCGRGFKRNRNLRGHMETHTVDGISKYVCHVCGRTFAQKESLNGHLWVHGGKAMGDGDPSAVSCDNNVASAAAAPVPHPVCR